MKNESVGIAYQINISADATNGDVIKVLFKEVNASKVTGERLFRVTILGLSKYFEFDSDWWNAKYER